MKIIDQENVNYSQVFNDEVFIRGGRNINFNDSVFNKQVSIHVDRDIEAIRFDESIFNAKLHILYGGAEGIIDGLVLNTGKFNQHRMQLFYSDFESQKHRRTKGLIIKDMVTSCPTESAYMLENCDNPIIEGNTIIGVGGFDNRNGMQINGCLNPVVRKNTVMNTHVTSKGDGSGIIIDWCVDKLTETTDALVEDNICIGQRSNKNCAGIENFRGIRSVIRRNILIGNSNGLRFVKHSDYNAYGNVMLSNSNDVLFYECTDRGYQS